MRLSPLIPVLSDSGLKTLCKQCSFTKKNYTVSGLTGVGSPNQNAFVGSCSPWSLSPYDSLQISTLKLPSDVFSKDGVHLDKNH